MLVLSGLAGQWFVRFWDVAIVVNVTARHHACVASMVYKCRHRLT